MADHAQGQSIRLVLLGASNLTRGISTVIESARLAFGCPLQIFAALGHGRAYGMYSTLLGRGLPGIVECGIWQALQRAHDACLPGDNQGSSPRVAAGPPLGRTYALLTDIGNDIMYGASPALLAQWVELCIERLQRIDPGACITMTRLPMESLRRVRPWRYRLVKTMFFPTRPLTFEQAMARGEELNERIDDLGVRRGAAMIDLQREWFGFDPIHIKLRLWSRAWGQIMCACAGEPPVPYRRAMPSPRRWRMLRSCTPERWWWWGRRMHRQQPCGHLADGTTVSFY